MKHKAIFYSHTFAKKVLEDTYRPTCVILRYLLLDRAPNVWLSDVSWWTHAQFKDTDTVVWEYREDGSVRSFDLVPRLDRARAKLREDMANRLLSEPNRRVTLYIRG